LAYEYRFRTPGATAKSADFRRFRRGAASHGMQHMSHEGAHGGGKPAPMAGFGADTLLQCGRTRGRRRDRRRGRDGVARHGGGLASAGGRAHAALSAAGLRHGQLKAAGNASLNL
jgi:hypothetical protein